MLSIATSKSLSVRCTKYVEESEIRAATVMAVEKIREAVLAKRGISLLAVEVDWLLWNWGESVKDDIAPHHRTLTIFY